jgi:hypothetical protein
LGSIWQEVASWRNLVCHPDTPPERVDRVRFDLQTCLINSRLQTWQFWLSFLVDAKPADVCIPSPAKPYRTDGLWKTTCFELFLRCGDGSYLELNFSPSSEWAAYRFTGYREGVEPLNIDPPSITFSTGNGQPWISITVDLSAPVYNMLAVSAVIEESDGTKSFWALRHPPGTPDFHHPDCFALTLPAPKSP